MAKFLGGTVIVAVVLILIVEARVKFTGSQIECAMTCDFYC